MFGKYKPFILGNLVCDKRTGTLMGQIIEVLENTVIIERGYQTAIRTHDKIQPFEMSIGDKVYVKGTDKSFVIEEFYFSDKADLWKATPIGGNWGDGTDISKLESAGPHKVIAFPGDN